MTHKISTNRDRIQKTKLTDYEQKKCIRSTNCINTVHQMLDCGDANPIQSHPKKNLSQRAEASS